ncbi:glycoside hydrolase family 43 protein [Maricaulis sp.]|uniref:glycoside hydrolase family 43 protein n=1 Tax=Maricaulis sp. TaxID=1486257 RepID=UPI0026084448|nr:glycoside hydrolase family 43 protein [Maricaulis sp.]
MLSRLLATASAAALLAGCQGAGQNERDARFAWFEYSGSDPVHEIEAGPGEFRNPVLSGFYPDPSNTRAGEDYYLVTSTFAYYPGLPVFHSRDLVNWTQIGNAIDRPDMVDFGNLGLSRGLFAPAIEYHDGVFYILNTCVDCGGNFLVTAEDPAGPWSDPVWLPDLEGGIDPSLFVDDDGRAYILNNGPPDRTPEYEGHRAIWIQEFDLENLETFGPRTVLVDGGIDFSQQPVWIEGPHIYKVDGRYLLSAAEGGTAINHSQVVLESDAPMGPYEAWENNPILTQRDLPPDRAHPVTSAGHADLVQTPDGDWWATFLAVRPYQGDMYNTGRETFLMPVRWENGWPRITAPDEEIPPVMARPGLPDRSSPAVPMSGAFTVREEFDGDALPLHWLTVRNPQDDWMRVENGDLVLEPRSDGLGDFANPSYAGRRQQHIFAQASTEVRFAPSRDGDRAGLAVFQNDEYWYLASVSRLDGETAIRVERRAGPGDPADGETLVAVPFSAESPVQLMARARGAEYDFFYRFDEGDWVPLLENADGTILSTQVAGGFVGVTMGPYAHAGE